MYVGIDVSKEQLDVASEDGAFAGRFPNDEEGHGQLTKRLLEVSPTLVVLESTAQYQTGGEPNVWRPRRFRSPSSIQDKSATSRKRSGILAKTDKLDAGVIARFGATGSPLAQPLPDDQTLELEALLTRRRQLVGMIAARRTDCKPSSAPPSKAWQRKACATRSAT